MSPIIKVLRSLVSASIVVPVTFPEVELFNLSLRVILDACTIVLVPGATEVLVVLPDVPDVPEVPELLELLELVNGLSMPIASNIFAIIIICIIICIMFDISNIAKDEPELPARALEISRSKPEALQRDCIMRVMSKFWIFELLTELLFVIAI